jgi:hypothetical protein
MSSVVYACIIAGVATFSDRPCAVERPSLTTRDALAFADLRELPPRLGVDRGGRGTPVEPGSQFQVTGFDSWGRPVGYWVPAGRAVPFVVLRRRGR